MRNINEWIDTILEDIVNPEVKLSDTLLKVQILAYKIDNQPLKGWVNNELNGYRKKDKPNYREIPTAVKATLIQDRGFGGAVIQNNFVIPLDMLDNKLSTALRFWEVDSSVSEIENMLLKEDGSFSLAVSPIFFQYFNKLLANEWQVQSARQLISNNSLQGILSKIKSTLINFILELNKEFGNSSDISIMSKKREVDNIFGKTIGAISGHNIQISYGDNSSSFSNSGENAKVNMATGNNNTLNISSEVKNEIEEFVKVLKSNLDNLSLTADEKEDISNEVIRVEAQLKRDEPKTSIIGAALNTIHQILLGVTTDAYSPIILEKLRQIIPSLT